MAEASDRNDKAATPPAAETETGSTDASRAPDKRQVAQRAYERFQMRGGEPGRDLEDWFEAERELRGGSTE
jgi:hypothetical protein